MTTTKIKVRSNTIPKGFNDFKIVHLSDLHNKSFGKNQKHLVSRIKQANPDIIVFTGDIIDARIKKYKGAIALLKELRDICPVYYVTGNHEWGSGIYNELKEKMLDEGVIILEDGYVELSNNSSKIYIIGVNDPKSYSNGILEETLFNKALKSIVSEIPKEEYILLLSHRPEYFKSYSSLDIDLVFSGHAHGGQIRLPYLGGLYVPNQGILPKYTEGAYTEDNTTMILSRGLGNTSIAPQRIFNRPEIIEVTLLRNDYK